METNDGESVMFWMTDHPCLLLEVGLLAASSLMMVTPSIPSFPSRPVTEKKFRTPAPQPVFDPTPLSAFRMFSSPVAFVGISLAYWGLNPGLVV